MIEALLIATAICIDSFALGITYGIKSIKIPKSALFTINLIIVLVLSISVWLGHIVQGFISEFAATLISCVLLVIIGAFFMIEGYLKYLAKNKAKNCSKYKLINFCIPKLGIIIDIGLDVTKADVNISGDIDIKEAIYLGAILSIDSLGAGFGYSVNGINPLYFLAFVFFINIIAISCGLLLGKKIDNSRTDLKTSLLPGAILILTSILKWI